MSMMKTELLESVEALAKGGTSSFYYTIATLANIASLVGSSVERINWLGFYLVDLSENSLILGPFYGKPACTEIPFGKGVCGTAWQQGKSLIVDDVSTFVGHIVCDSDSKSEIVVPIIHNKSVVGVLDVDSPFVERFTQTELTLFESVAKIVGSELHWKMS